MENPNHLQKILEVTEALSKDHIELLNTDFTMIKDELLDMCTFYANDPHRLGYFQWKDCKSLSYIDFKSKNIISIPGETNFDCFQFVWFILEKLAQYQTIPSKITSYSPTFDTLTKLKLAIQQSYLTELTDQSQLTCGVIFFTKNANGWDKKGARHMGFYFNNGDKIQMISNRQSKKGVDIEYFDLSDFFERFSNMSECYISSN
jgi:hypothetical protein